MDEAMAQAVDIGENDVSISLFFGLLPGRGELVPKNEKYRLCQGLLNSNLLIYTLLSNFPY